jgi:hypothetical protein
MVNKSSASISENQGKQILQSSSKFLKKNQICQIYLVQFLQLELCQILERGSLIIILEIE